MIIYVGRDGFYADVDIRANAINGFCSVKKAKALVGICRNDLAGKNRAANSKLTGLLRQDGKVALNHLIAFAIH